jgi:trimeric autotransporter adhesin
VLTPANAAPGAPVSGTVNLNAAAPAAGAVVALSSSNPAVATVPGTATAAAGATTATFTAIAVGAGSATITASLGGSQSSATLTVAAPAVVLSSLALSASNVTGGNPVSGIVTLSGAAPAGGALVALSGADPATVPASVTVVAGSTSESFTIATRAVGGATLVTISASFSGVTMTAPLTVLSLAPDVSLRSISLSPASVPGGTTSQGTLTLDGPAGIGGALVTLSSATPGVATVPPSVTIAAGSTSGTFIVSTSTVSSSTMVAITGIHGATRTVTLTVNR